MKLLEKSKDGGPESTVWAYWLFEIKWLGSIVLLRFEDGSRDAYHSHAFNSVSWLLSGDLFEITDVATTGRYFPKTNNYVPSLSPILTPRSTTHKVISVGRSWVLSFRGPWAKTWVEKTPDGKETTLTNGRMPVIGAALDPRNSVCPIDTSPEFKEKLRQFGASRDA